MHATESGVVDHLAISDSHALSIARASVKSLSYKALPYEVAQRKEEVVEEPVYDANELGGVVGTQLKKTWDMREVVARVVDGSRFQEWKKEYGPTIVTGFGEWHAPAEDASTEADSTRLYRISSHSAHPRSPSRHRTSPPRLTFLGGPPLRAPRRSKLTHVLNHRLPTTV